MNPQPGTTIQLKSGKVVTALHHPDSERMPRLIFVEMPDGTRRWLFKVAVESNGLQ